MAPTYTDEGLCAAHEIRARHPGVGILILTQFLEIGTVNRLITQSAEGLGYLLKDGFGSASNAALSRACASSWLP